MGSRVCGLRVYLHVRGAGTRSMFFAILGLEVVPLCRFSFTPSGSIRVAQPFSCPIPGRTFGTDFRSKNCCMFQDSGRQITAHEEARPRHAGARGGCSSTTGISYRFGVSGHVAFNGEVDPTDAPAVACGERAGGLRE